MTELDTLTGPDIRHDWRLDEVMALFAGRTELSEETQALCFLAGAGSIFCGDQLLTTPNPSFDTDMEMLGDLGLDRQAMPRRSTQPEEMRR